jgi:hypothetical protein
MAILSFNVLFYKVQLWIRYNNLKNTSMQNFDVSNFDVSVAKWLAHLPFTSKVAGSSLGENFSM